MFISFEGNHYHLFNLKNIVYIASSESQKFICLRIRGTILLTMVSNIGHSQNPENEYENTSQNIVSTYKEMYCWRCPWCNGYRRWKWIRRHEFKSWTRLITFHIALIPLGKVWIQLFSLQLWVNSRTDWFLQRWWGNLSRRRKYLYPNLLNSA